MWEKSKRDSKNEIKLRKAPSGLERNPCQHENDDGTIGHNKQPVLGGCGGGYAKGMCPKTAAGERCAATCAGIIRRRAQILPRTAARFLILLLRMNRPDALTRKIEIADPTRRFFFFGRSKQGHQSDRKTNGERRWIQKGPKAPYCYYRTRPSTLPRNESTKRQPPTSIKSTG